jgi:hypothetical protein
VHISEIICFSAYAIGFCPLQVTLVSVNSLVYRCRPSQAGTPMSELTFEQTIEGLRSRIFPLSRLVHEFARSIDEPAMASRAIGFRYQNPDFRHFCLLRAARIVSALNATLELAIAGFPQEIGILHRTIHEFSSHIDAVMVQVEGSGGVSGELEAFIKDFFEDSQRGLGPTKRKILSQKYVNELVGSRLDEARHRNPADPNWRPAAHLHQNIAFIFSNYVHGRYPETMDLYGGTHGRFQLTE